MICISHCHIMVLSMLMLWLPKNTFFNLFFVFEHFFSFLRMCFKIYVHYMYLHFTYKIVNEFHLWVFHLFAYNLQTLFFFDQNYTITGFHDVTTTFLFQKKPFIMLRLVNTFVLLILGHFMCHCCIYLLHIHFVSWFMMFSMTSMYLSTFLYLSYKCKFVF